MKPIIIAAPGHDLDSLRSALCAALDNPEIIIRREVQRGIAPEVLIALTGGATTVLVALINGIFKLAVARTAQRIIVTDANGRSIDLPAFLSEKERAEIIKSMAANTRISHIEIPND